MGGAFGGAETAKLNHTNLSDCKALCREHHIPKSRQALPLNTQTIQCKLSFMDTVQQINAANRYRYLLLRLAESTSVSPRARENASLEVGIRVAHQRTRNQAIQEITGYIRIFSLAGNGNRPAPVPCKPSLTRSDTMQINSLLDPLDSTVANRSHFLLYVWP